MRTRLLITAAAALLAATLFVPAAFADPAARTYEVTITNLATGQPLSPAVAVTHQKSVRLFQAGRPASAAIEAIAEDGDNGPAVDALTGARHVTDVVNAGRPLGTTGSTSPFTDTITFEIQAEPGDRLSLAAMLICTNDGFTGLDSLKLPTTESTFYLYAYDAGTELNTEASRDIVDPCSALGPVMLAGDPNGNEDVAVNDSGVIAHHPGIAGTGDLLPAHDWDGPVAMVTVTRIG
jgi:hypothetical protein